MQEGYFYFLTDKYCNDNNKYYVMSNKETDSQGNPHKRPCYYAIEDLDNFNILWMIPISSKVEKYKKIKKDKINKYNTKDYDGLEFGFVNGNQRAFLIQNMCPALYSDIDGQYLDSKTKKPVSISENTKRNIIQKARKLINLSKRGKRCTMTNIPEMLKNIEK